MKKRFVSLLEIMVAFTITGILLSSLLPYLGRAREEAGRAQCLSNLMLTASYATDHGGRIPSENLTYNRNNWSGERVNNNWYWHDFTGSYLESVTSSILANELFHSPSRTIRDVKYDGKQINNSLTCWGNPIAWKYEESDVVKKGVINEKKC